MSREKSDVQMLVRIPKSLKTKVEAFATSEKISVSELTRRALEAYMTSKTEENEGVSPRYKMAMLKCLDDDDFRALFLQKLNDSSNV